MKVYELAKNLGVKSVFLMDKIRKEWKMPVKSHMESLSPDLVQKIESKFLADSGKKKKTTIVSKRKMIKKSSSQKEVTSADAKKTTVKKPIKKVAVAQSVRTSSSVAKTPKTPETPKTSNIIRRRKQDQVPLQAVSTSPELKEKPVAKVSSTSSPSQTKEASSHSEASQRTFTDDSQWKKENVEKDLQKPVKKLAEKEVKIKFQAADFRKREIIFQHKKKRNVITGELKKTHLAKKK